MPSAQAVRAKSGTELTPEQLEHVYKNHLNIRFNEKKDLLEIGWLCSCKDKSCDAPGTVAFYVCLDPPCPPRRG